MLPRNASSLAIDVDGALLIADSGNHRIRLLRDGRISTFAGSGTAGRADGPLSSAQLNRPTGLAVASDGTVYVADWGNHLIRRIAGGQLTTIAGTGSGGFADGPASTAQFSNPHSIAIGKSGELYLGDCGGSRVRVLKDGEVSTLAGNGVIGFRNGPAADAQFAGAAGVLLADAGVLLGDVSNHAIRLIANGQVSTFAGQPPNAGYADGPAATAQFNYPVLIGLDRDGSVVVPDQDNRRIRRITKGMVTTVAGSGERGLQDGPVATARFNTPRAVAVDRDGRIYVSDWYNHAIRVIAP